MKNLHLIPTEKPSRLSTLNSGKLNFGEEIMSSSNSKPQHIYITNLEEIKVGDWVFNLKSKEVYPIFELWEVVSYEKKIILTTDQDLIKDGVQAIDEEFLQWFVKNPTCEEVEIANDLKYFNVDELRERHLKGLPHLYSESIGYKIIIPQEEPKQETIEEVAERLTENAYQNDIWEEGSLKRMGYYKGVQDGVKWQQERMYSEEEVIELLNKREDYINQTSSIFDYITATEWFEQFKKK